MIGKSNIGGENLNTQLTTQETLIQTITESLVGKATLANATADKIIEGFCAYVGQQLIQGTAKQGLDLSMFGWTEVYEVTVTPSSTTDTLAQAFAKTPQYVSIEALDDFTNGSYQSFLVRSRHCYMPGETSLGGRTTYKNASGETIGNSYLAVTGGKLKFGSGEKFVQGVRYKIIAIA